MNLPAPYYAFRDPASVCSRCRAGTCPQLLPFTPGPGGNSAGSDDGEYGTVYAIDARFAVNVPVGWNPPRYVPGEPTWERGRFSGPFSEPRFYEELRFDP